LGQYPNDEWIVNAADRVRAFAFNFARQFTLVRSDEVIDEAMVLLVQEGRKIVANDETHFRRALFLRLRWRLLDWMRVSFGRKTNTDYEQILRAHACCVSIEGTGPGGLAHLIADPSPQPEQQVIDAEDVEQLLSRCTPRERYIVEQSFFAGRTLSAVGEALGVTESRISQIRTQALKKMRQVATAA